MRRRPWALVTLSVLHFVAPVGNIVFNAVITNKDVFQYLKYAASPVYLQRNWVIVVAPLVAGLAIYAMKKWSFYVYLFSLTTLFVFSYSGYLSKSGSISLAPVIVVYLINIAVVAYFLLPAVRNVYFDRRMRWWEIQARYKCHFKCQWKDISSQQQWSGQIGNISINGLFLKAQHLPEDESQVEITIPFDDGVSLQFTGKAIIHGRVDAVGFGVQFSHTAESKKSAKALVADLESKGMRISSLEGRPEDSFSYWIRTLVTTGRGLFPKSDKPQKPSS